MNEALQPWLVRLIAEAAPRSRRATTSGALSAETASLLIQGATVASGMSSLPTGERRVDYRRLDTAESEALRPRRLTRES
jgi:hypothetical protein